MLWLSIVFLGLAWLSVPRGEADPALSTASEYQLKAAFLYNFLKFVDWPPPKGGPLAIGVVGNARFAEVLEQTVRGKTVYGGPVTVVRFAKQADVRGCQEVFIAAPAPANISLLPGVLTVGEDPGFLRAGGILNFYLEDNKVRFEISTEGAKTSGLHVSVQLLTLGKAR
jgi:hypothetical protein